MEKAYDLKDLLGRLKNRGLDVAEDAVEGVFDDVMDWLEESAPISKTPFDDMVMGLAKPLRLYVKSKTDLNKDGA